MNKVYGQKLMKHGLAVMLVGCIGGFLLIFSLIGGASLSPLPVFLPFELPGSPQGWRVVHYASLMNGIMALAVGIAMLYISLTDAQARRVYLSMAFAIWSFVLFYTAGMFAPNHGLTLGANRLGEGNLAGAIAFLPALVGAVTITYAIVVLMRGRFDSAASSRL